VNIFGMKSIDTLMKKNAPQLWYEYKKNKITRAAKDSEKNYEN
jgi:hypothetical protein